MLLVPEVLLLIASWLSGFWITLSAIARLAQGRVLPGSGSRVIATLSKALTFFAWRTLRVQSLALAITLAGIVYLVILRGGFELFRTPLSIVATAFGALLGLWLTHDIPERCLNLSAAATASLDNDSKHNKSAAALASYTDLIATAPLVSAAGLSYLVGTSNNFVQLCAELGIVASLGMTIALLPWLIGAGAYNESQELWAIDAGHAGPNDDRFFASLLSALAIKPSSALIQNALKSTILNAILLTVALRDTEYGGIWLALIILCRSSSIFAWIPSFSVLSADPGPSSLRRMQLAYSFISIVGFSGGCFWLLKTEELPRVLIPVFIAVGLTLLPYSLDKYATSIESSQHFLSSPKVRLAAWLLLSYLAYRGLLYFAPALAASKHSIVVLMLMGLHLSLSVLSGAHLKCELQKAHSQLILLESVPDTHSRAFATSPMLNAKASHHFGNWAHPTVLAITLVLPLQFVPTFTAKIDSVWLQATLIGLMVPWCLLFVDVLFHRRNSQHRPQLNEASPLAQHNSAASPQLAQPQFSAPLDYSMWLASSSMRKTAFYAPILLLCFYIASSKWAIFPSRNPFQSFFPSESIFLVGIALVSCTLMGLSLLRLLILNGELTFETENAKHEATPLHRSSETLTDATRLISIAHRCFIQNFEPLVLAGLLIIASTAP